MAHGCERKWQARPSASSETFSCSSEAAWTLPRRLQRTRMALVATHGSRYRYDRLTEKSARAIIAIFFFLFGKQRQKILSPVDSICDSVHRSLASYYSFSYSTLHAYVSRNRLLDHLARNASDRIEDGHQACAIANSSVPLPHTTRCSLLSVFWHNTEGE